MSSERPNLTPYNFVSNNPIMRIDPTGLLDDDYKLDKEGNISLLRETDDDFDVLYNDDESNSIQVDKGTLGNVKTQSGTDSEGNEFSYDVLKVRGDDQASSLFEFASDNTNVEWGQFMLGEEGDKGLNYLTTSHDKSTERGGTHLLTSQLHDGYTIRGHIHNHPGNTPYPSGLSDGTGDIGFARGVENWYTGKYNQAFRYIFREAGNMYLTIRIQRGQTFLSK